MLLWPLRGVFLVIYLAVTVVKVFALIDASIRPAPAYVAAGKQTKLFWVVILAVAVLVFGTFLSIAGLVAALVYIVDVRPAVRGIPRGGSGRQMGPYGPW